MRLQDLIPVIVSLRRSESERRWCGFTPRGGKGGRGHKPLTDGRARLSPTPPFNQRPRRPMRLELSPPINPNQPITEKQGGGPSSNCCGSNVGPQSDRGGKKRKSNSRKEKSLDCGTRSERRGTRFFYWLDRRGFLIAVCTWWTDGRAPLGRTERIWNWKLDLFDWRKSHGRYAELRWIDWWSRIRSRTSRTYYPHLQLCHQHF